MARKQNLKNLKTETDGLDVLHEKLAGFVVPTSEERRFLYGLCNIDYKRYSRSVDGVVLFVDSVAEVKSTEDFQFIEVKTTKAKNVTELPYGVFFGFTQNEEDLFRTQPNYRLCIVHTVLEEFCLIDFSQYESMIQNKRIQYQINFKRK